MRKLAISLVAAVALLAACSSSSKSSSSTPTTAAGTVTSTLTPTDAAADALHVLVTNDDGVGAPGIDALVEGLRKLPNTTVTVVAPAKNQSGSGGKTTAGALTVSDAKTKSGYAAKAVNGYPADTIVWAIDKHGISERPNVVISGINLGQNLGTLVDVSGTIGARRAAASRGIPALAVSQGIADVPDFPSGTTAALNWLSQHRAALVARDVSSTTPAELDNVNIPTCTSGTPKPVVKVPVDTTGTNPIAAVDCTVAYPNPKTDVDAFLHGYIAETDNLSLTPASK